MRYETLIHPFVTVVVNHDSDGMEVVEVKIDWDDTLVNLSAEAEDGKQDIVWEEQEGSTPPEAKFACAYIDSDDVQARVLAALQPVSS